ncbi:MAG: flagellar hook assembly protein FlgD [Spirochaetales bacterium]|nr:flagellar hook assembly protein FlgD [Spirochaetales bacterium]
MNISDFMIPDQDYARLQMEVDTYNKTLNRGRIHKNELDKDDFLKLLITQLSHQDPTKPMEDKEFIAQMAQFSSLEQMTNMNDGLKKVASLISQNQAVALLGKTVEIMDGDKLVTGKVDKVSGGTVQQVLVNGTYYDYTQVESIRNE